MFLIRKLNNTNRYQRVWLVITAIWILVANVLYYKDLYFISCWSEENEYPLFYDLWSEFTGLMLYLPKDFAGLDNRACYIHTYSFSGHLYFVLIPCALIGLAYLASEWVKKGKVT
jgi:hypothetical protein